MARKEKANKEDVVRLLTKEGKTVKEVADRFGVTLSAIYTKLKRLGVKVTNRNKIPESDVKYQEAVDSYLSGGSSKEIGAKFGVSGNTILNMVRKKGGAIRPKGKPKGRKNSVCSEVSTPVEVSPSSSS